MDIYQKLRRHLDQMPVPFPATDSGIEIEFLKQLFTPMEAQIACEVSAFPEPAEKIHSRLKKKGLKLEEVREQLRVMTEKGTILGIWNDKKGVMNFQKAPLVIGIFEFQLNHLERDVVKLFNAYKDAGFDKALMKMKTPQMRTIPVNISLRHQFLAGNYDDVRQIVKDSPGPFALMNCICRQAKDLMSEPCRITDERESCITLESSAKHMISRGVAREISREELLKFLTKAKKEGLVLQPENNQHPHFICCCCGCCCGILATAAKYDKPAEYIRSNYTMHLDSDVCDVCGDCIERCQMKAIARVNNHVEIKAERCIGCGVCVPVCKQKALQLTKKEKETVPPADRMEMYKRMMIERFGVPGTLGMVLKSKMGMKI
jgi:Na+-translocating ferredoxin:NAD+ oxidoreductase subunit B